MAGNRRGAGSLALYLAAGILVGLAAGSAAFFGFPSGTEDAAVSFRSSTPGALETPEAQSAAAPVVGAPAPDFTLTDLEGETYTLADLRGHALLLNFWATWCYPCREEMPLLDSVQARYAEAGLVVLGVDADEPEETVTEFRDEVGVTFPLLLDPGGEVQQLYRIRGYPTTFFVDPEGVIRAQHIGILGESRLERALETVGIGDS
jgi:peroxiredoxin